MILNYHLFNQNNDNIIDKAIDYNNKLYDFITYLKYNINKDSNYLQIIPNPFIDNEYQVLNAILKYNFKEMDTLIKLKYINKIKELINDKLKIEHNLSYIYHITLSSNLDIEVFVKLFDNPIKRVDINKDDLKQKVDKIKYEFIKMIFKYIPDLKDKIIVDKACIFGKHYLYPTIKPKSILDYNQSKYYNDDICVLYNHRLHNVIAYYTEKKNNYLSSNYKTNVYEYNITYSYSDNKTKDIVNLIKKWINIFIKIMENTQINNTKQGYNKDVSIHLPILQHKRTKGLIAGIKIDNDFKNELMKISEDFKIKLDYDTQNKKHYLSFYRLCDKLLYAKYIIDYFNMQGELFYIFKNDYKEIRNYLDYKVNEIKIKPITNEIIRNSYLLKENDHLYIKHYTNGLFTPILIELNHIRIYPALRKIFKNKINFNDYNRNYFNAINQILYNAIIDNKIKTIDKIEKYGFWHNDYYISDDKYDHIVKYPSIINNHKSDRKLLDKFVSSLPVHPIFAYHFLIKSILTKANHYLTDIVIVNQLDNDIKSNFMLSLLNVLNPIKDNESDEIMFKDVINRTSYKYLKNDIDNYRIMLLKLNRYFNDTNISKLITLTGNIKGEFFYTLRNNSIILNNTNAYVVLNKSKDDIFKEIKHSNEILIRSYYINKVDNDNVYNLSFDNKDKNAILLRTMIDISRDAIKHLKGSKKNYYTFESLLYWLIDYLDYRYYKNKINNNYFKWSNYAIMERKFKKNA